MGRQADREDIMSSPPFPTGTPPPPTHTGPNPLPAMPAATGPVVGVAAGQVEDVEPGELGQGVLVLGVAHPPAPLAQRLAEPHVPLPAAAARLDVAVEVQALRAVVRAPRAVLCTAHQRQGHRL